MCFMHGILHVCLMWQAAVVQMPLRSSYIIINAFQSLDVQGRMIGLSECQEHFREGNHMLSWPVINEKRSHYFETEWLRVLEQSMVLFKDPPSAILGARCLSYVCTDRADQLTLGGISLGQPRLFSQEDSSCSRICTYFVCSQCPAVGLTLQRTLVLILQ